MPLRVVIADANEVARRFSARVVRDAFSDPIELVECTRADAAAQAWQEAGAQGGPRLLLVDVDLPPGGAASLLAPSPPGASQVVTMLYADDDALFPLLAAGADGYLLKEDRYEALVEQLQRIAQGQSPITPALARRVLARLAGTAPAASWRLTDGEADLLGQISRGFTLREVAQQLKSEPRLVAAQVRGVYRKLHPAGGTP